MSASTSTGARRDQKIRLARTIATLTTVTFVLTLILHASANGNTRTEHIAISLFYVTLAGALAVPACFLPAPNPEGLERYFSTEQPARTTETAPTSTNRHLRIVRNLDDTHLTDPQLNSTGA